MIQINFEDHKISKKCRLIAANVISIVIVDSKQLRAKFIPLVVDLI